MDAGRLDKRIRGWTRLAVVIPSSTTVICRHFKTQRESMV